MQYVYRGPVPVPDEAGELLHPGDVREFSEAPDCPPWEPLDGPQAEAPPPPPGPELPAAALPEVPAEAPAGEGEEADEEDPGEEPAADPTPEGM